jgi:hypothetical protein
LFFVFGNITNHRWDDERRYAKIPAACRVCSRRARLPCGRRGVGSRIRARGDSEPSSAAPGKGGPRPGGDWPRSGRVGDAAHGAAGGTAAGCVWLRSVRGAQILKSNLYSNFLSKCTKALIFVNFVSGAPRRLGSGAGTNLKKVLHMVTVYCQNTSLKNLFCRVTVFSTRLRMFVSW